MRNTPCTEAFRAPIHKSLCNNRAYRIKSGSFTRDLFDRDRFCRDFRDGDSHHRVLQPYYATLYSRYNHCTHVGDKLPNLYEHYQKIIEYFPDSKLIYMLRNPFHLAQSFERRAMDSSGEEGDWPKWRGWKKAIEEWNCLYGLNTREAI